MRRLLTEIELGFCIASNGRKILLGRDAPLHRRAKEADDLLLAFGGVKKFRPGAGEEIALYIAGAIRQIVGVIRANFERARTDRLPDEEGGDVALAESGRQYLGIEILD